MDRRQGAGIRSIPEVLLYFLYICRNLRRKLFSGHIGLTIKMHWMWLIVQITITVITLRGDIWICLSNNLVEDV